MPAECANPLCSASFRRLAEGKVFRLDAHPALRLYKSNRVEYFWLCHRCSSTLTLRVREDGTAGNRSAPRSDSRCPSLYCSYLGRSTKGLLLCSVPLPEYRRGRARTR